MTTPMSDAALDRLEYELTSESRPVLIPADDIRALVARVRAAEAANGRLLDDWDPLPPLREIAEMGLAEKRRREVGDGS